MKPPILCPLGPTRPAASAMSRLVTMLTPLVLPATSASRATSAWSSIPASQSPSVKMTIEASRAATKTTAASTQLRRRAAPRRPRKTPIACGPASPLVHGTGFSAAPTDQPGCMRRPWLSVLLSGRHLVGRQPTAPMAVAAKKGNCPSKPRLFLKVPSLLPPSAQGHRGFVFKTGDKGTGYYLDGG